MSRSRPTLVALALCAGSSVSVYGADRAWDNGSTNFQWDTLSLNWAAGSAWNNAAGDGALFGAAGAGAINVAGPINIDSVSFTANGYSLNGPGSLNIVAGSSTWTTAVANCDAGVTAAINIPINSIGLAFQKIGAGTLEVSGPLNVTGDVFIDPRGSTRADLILGGVFGDISGGTLKLMNSSVIAPSTRVSIGNALLDTGANDLTLAGLVFTNQHSATPPPYNPATGVANSGIYGSGTLRINGEINVLGTAGGNTSSNSIGTPLDLQGGTQIIRMGATSSFGLSSALQFTAPISNGSILKTMGYNHNGVFAQVDGIGLLANNTYAGSTVLNGGQSVITGTNATTSLQISGGFSGGGTSFVTLQGASGSLGSATLIQALAGGTFQIDNNAGMGAGNAQPTIPAAQNNNRIRDDAEIRLRDGNFIYRGQSTVAASETFGSLNQTGGHSLVTLAPVGAGGTVTLTAGSLSLAPRSTMQVSTTTLGAASKLFITGSMPTADATGILPRMVGSNDFLTYNGVTGLTPLTTYSPDFNTAGTNVAVAAAANVASSVNINALKRTGTNTTTIAAGQTLGITSGMIFNPTGTGTFSGGTIAFGATPGVTFGTNIVNSALTGSNGLINGSGTLTLAGDLSGLSGTITHNLGTTNLNTNTFAGNLQVRTGTLNIGTSQTLAGQGAITLGVPGSDTNLVNTIPTLGISNAGVNAIIGRDIIVDNGTLDIAGAETRYSVMSAALTPLSNTTGSQTITGNVLLNSHLRIQGGGGGGTGATNFNGNISGIGRIGIPNGRVSFNGNVSNSGGYIIGDQGFTTKVAFTGTGSGTGPIKISGGNSNTFSYESGSLPGGVISVWNSSAGTAPQIIPLESSTIANVMSFGTTGTGNEGNATVNVGAGIAAEWSGSIQGISPLTKSGTGTLTLSSGSSTYNGALIISAGGLRVVNGTLPASSATIASGAVLGGTGAITGNVSVNAGGFLEPGSSIGTFGTGNLTIAGTLRDEIDLNNAVPPSAADLVVTTGTVNVTGATLALQLLNAPVAGFIGEYIVIANDGNDPVTGTFASITGLPGGYSATVNYGFSGIDSVGRIGTGNDISVSIVPAPSGVLVLGVMAVPMFRRRR